MWLFRERARPVTWVGTLLAAAGLAVIGFHLDATITALGVALVVGAALGWAVANIIVKRAARDSAQPIDMLGFMVWSSLFAVPPLLLLTVALEGSSAAMVLGGITLITLAGRRRP